MLRRALFSGKAGRIRRGKDGFAVPVCEGTAAKLAIGRKLKQRWMLEAGKGRGS